MIDIHSHILPNIDDGSQSLDDSVAMLDTYAQLGVRTIVATPHLHGAPARDYLRNVEKATAWLAPIATARNIELLSGFEIRLDHRTIDHIAGDIPITLGASRTLLVDLPLADWPLYADSALFALQSAGYRVVLAHPERYPSIQRDPDQAGSLLSHGVILQSNIASFSTSAESIIRKTAERLLKHRWIHLLATDAHGPMSRLAAVPDGLNRVRTLVGEDETHRLTVCVPTALLYDHSIPPAVPVPPTRLWSRLFSSRRHQY